MLIKACINTLLLATCSARFLHSTGDVRTEQFELDSRKPLSVVDENHSLSSEPDEIERGEIPEFWKINEGICPESICKKNGEEHGGFADGVSPFYEGDIVLNMNQWRMIKRNRGGRQRRAIAKNPVLLWPDGVLPYKVDKTLRGSAKTAIRAALRHIANRTCIRFRKKRKTDKNFVYFVNEPGCWSQVGRQQGEQRIGAGSIGCDYKGTMIHETGHSLGFWHEQSRADRNKFVKINFKEMSSLGPPNFQIQNFSSTTNLDYTYDYESIMHYGERFFSNTGRRTIDLRGIGKRLKLKIGNRDGLSDLDIAQLRDMYNCNKRTKTVVTNCPWDGFPLTVKGATSCYFVNKKRQAYSEALKICRQKNGHLLHINSREELAGVVENLKRYSNTQTTWRMGGRLLNGSLWWHLGNGQYLQKIRQAKWKKGHPAKYSTIGLELEPKTGKVEWVGLWAGSYKDSQNNVYPSVCEIGLMKKQCYRTKDRTGRRYRGKHDFTRGGITCQSWTEQYPRTIQWKGKSKKALAKEGLGNHRSCRNPFGEKEAPWCYTTKGPREWDYCDIPLCDPKTKEIYI